MKIEKYVVGSEKNEVYNAISNSVPKDNEYIHFRLNGRVKDLCNDIFYSAHKDGKVLSRLWMGYPKHKNSIGNWGCVHTAEECRGQGIARKTLDYWYEDIQKSNGEGNLVNILMATPEREAFVILTEEDKCVGWMLDGKICIYPLYADLINTL